MIEFHLTLKIPSNKSRPVIEALRVLAKKARAESGCITVEVYKTVAVPCRIVYQETWDSEESLRSMIASHHFSQLASLMELSTEPPKCEFRFISDVYGLEFAAKVRNCTD
ncbi:MAG: antibiotic biosynthesis monooxygenase [Gammaproteobacteria bacterium]|jgi:quinol monooxygenase YgiN|uniref:putative quinol monooxygenase n=1 Tax=Methylotuvimicrobium sp. TaxID=2822413 RepID=UPI000F64746C|nr:antibiotic biosynthesis monooxygenase [Gammaproteobacteria bacterium]